MSSQNEEAAQEINPVPLPWGGGKVFSQDLSF
jgi:hypothetical protein